MTQYLIILIVVALPIMFFGKGGLNLCATVIIANWLLGFSYNALMGTFTPWAWLLLIDTACALLMIRYRAGSRWPLILGASYLPMILCHFVYAYADGKWPQHGYWEALLYCAFVQIGLLALWGGSRLVSIMFDHSVLAAPRKHHNFNSEGVKP